MRYTETQTRPENPDLVRKPWDGNTDSPDVAQSYGILLVYCVNKIIKTTFFPFLQTVA